MKPLRILTLACAAVLVFPGHALRADGSVAASAFSLSIPVGVVMSKGNDEEAFFSVAAALSAPVLTVVAIKNSAEGATWVLERASDGVRISVKVFSSGGQAVSANLGRVLKVSATASGYVLSHAGVVVLFVPSAAGLSLVFSERFSE